MEYGNFFLICALLAKIAYKKALDPAGPSASQISKAT
jgi:hypothetical protein